MKKLAVMALLTAAGILLLWPFQTAAVDRKVSAIRCEGGVITPGASKLMTVEKCGPPQDEAMRQVRRAGGVIHEDDWLYDFGPEGGYYLLRFEGLGLKDIYGE